MSVGKSVVMFPLAEMQRLCGEAAVYARNGDADDLAAKIATLPDDDQRRAEVGARARQRINDGLMWPQQVPTLLGAVEAALHGVSGPARQPARSQAA
jgi:hypothetical protein